MSQVENEEKWVWVIVQDPGGEERFLGQRYEESGEQFIPAFFEKDEARDGLRLLAREQGRKYEVQAIVLSHLLKRAAKEGMAVFLLDAQGRILEKRGTRPPGGGD
ncbi:MAG: hypothetical protein JRF59_10265 [Deltaproteobacteria bacterium]|nr:hypothetical protein [Deltaproteobacteria bacterium]MBW1922625.1 hypothetical protein [Deltaproteobacteria bacterium]MBW1949400.1 hypothetical protein [Deltaproteobacteria bacterium]MBW2007858.1 hypothetical protein [Deltaproteobacteria bacterium]MBW2101716.1 hypothetical protein [Deltaproteobacteria bacterium]